MMPPSDFASFGLLLSQVSFLKKSVLLFATAGALLVNFPAHAAQDAGQQPVGLLAALSALENPFDSEPFTTAFAASAELRPALKDDRDLVKLFERLSRIDFSPDLKPKLLAIFGTERPLQMQRLPDTRGQVNYAASVMPHTFHDADGGEVSWGRLSLLLSTDKASRKLNMVGELPQLTFGGEADKLSFNNIHMVSKQTRGADNVWYGSFLFKMASLAIDDVAAKAQVAVAVGQGAKASTATSEIKSYGYFQINGVEIQSDVVRRGKFADVRYRFLADSIGIGSEHFDHLVLKMRLLHISAASLAAMKRSMEQDDLKDNYDPARRQELMALLKRFAKEAAKQGVALYIDDISGSYHGHTVSIKGGARFEKMSDADFDTPAALLGKLIAHGELRVPLALIEDVARALTPRLMPVGDQTPSAADIDAASKNIAAVIVGKAVGGGYARMEKKELRTTMDFKGGKLMVNGKEVALPDAPKSFDPDAAPEVVAAPELPPAASAPAPSAQPEQ